jgi:hypothetical protein
MTGRVAIFCGGLEELEQIDLVRGGEQPLS